MPLSAQITIFLSFSLFLFFNSVASRSYRHYEIILTQIAHYRVLFVVMKKLNIYIVLIEKYSPVLGGVYLSVDSAIKRGAKRVRVPDGSQGIFDAVPEKREGTIYRIAYSMIF